MDSPKENDINYADLTDENIINYENLIKEDEEKKPLVSEYDVIENYKVNYIDSEIFSKKINQLKNDCKGYRSVRKDGNCFYRSFSYKYFELINKNKNSKWSQEMKKIAKDSINVLTSVNFEKETIEDFYDFFMDAFDPQKFREISFVDEYTSNGIVFYLRLICSAELKINHEAYEMFLEEPLDSFISRQVEPLGRDVDNVQIMAIVNALKVCINIAYLDSTNNNVNWIKFGEEYQKDANSPVINLLFTPGHYDMLYHNDENV
ncbi:cysteine proteinase [Piromyces finnis]|uniref:ubiquitinyl hydrolase 1 n=1 Tax=Piromyces finnis TaxID=1754191 RepID=A0A1Y1V361_9FUNG|nr:cysteine proteinase [Piromyces finnis]|eukprot:ORX45348.1 cysteine proteinase [Piromyces finnis]